MKLIISELEALRSYVSREFYHVVTDLMANHDWRQIETLKLWQAPGTLKARLLNEFGELPETILFWEGYEFINEHAVDIYRLDCHKIILADDLHWWDERMKRKKCIGFALCKKILSTYAYALHKFYPDLSRIRKTAWIPHSASPDFMLSYNQHPENSILLSGSITEHYPLRQQMQRLHEERSYSITHHLHPGYHCQYDYEGNEDIGRGYAEKINKYRAGFTDSLKFKYVVAKYFEIPATGALLLADEAVREPLKELGFIENEHYLSVSQENLEERIQYVLDERNHPELDEIRRSGQELVWKSHKTSDRAKLINEACNI
jgi:hypothetical protein